MSQFISKLRDRDGIDWPTLAGTWKQSENISRLETFANNLDVSQAQGETDLLNSVPTPWARLLLFETALYRNHPSHADIEDQWRGLLGAIALAGPLRLNIAVKPINLSQQSVQFNSRIAKSFVDLRPQAPGGVDDQPAGQWDNFQMILIDDVVVGATSPRTLVFTGVAHQSPSSVPFRSPQGRLSDPAAYYRRFNDTFYLGLLAQWLNSFISSLENNQSLSEWLGAPPTAPGADQTSRLESLLGRLKAWRDELRDVQPASIVASPVSLFTLKPYDVITSLPADIQQEHKSDLFLAGHTDTIVYYRPESGSKLLSSFGQELVNESLQVYNGRWMQANQPLPVPLNFLPDEIRRIEDPVALFEDTLIQVALPDNLESVYALSMGDKEKSQRRYLYPFKADILKYFSPAQIAANTEIMSVPQTNSLRIEFKIPVANGRFVKATREYPLDTGVIKEEDIATPELAAWPDFICPTWSRYFYFKSFSVASPGRKPLDFEPTISSTYRRTASHTWYATREPVKAFVGSVDGKAGLLLLRDKEIPSPTRFWKVGVDFGSTHTRAFSLQLDKLSAGEGGYEFVTTLDAKIQPIRFYPRANLLTAADPKVLRRVFLALASDPGSPEMSELKTLLMMPEAKPGVMDNWLPREGYVYTYWIYDGTYDPNQLHFNLKWNSRKEDYDLRAFLRCLLLMIQAEATVQGAKVVWIVHTYPSVFTAALAAKHDGEWSDLENYLNLGVLDADSKVHVRPAEMTETVAVCRHLEYEQKAPPITNTITLDVGGSTTDMAVWANKRLKIQESVKFSSGIIGRFLQSLDAQGFLQWFVAVMQTAPHNLKNLSLASVPDKPVGYSLMFTNVLSLTEVEGRLDDLVKKVNAAQEARLFMSYIIYNFAGLLYYAGLLARKTGLAQEQDTFNIYFCGKGGTLMKWIHGREVIAQDMFEAGLFGPAGRGQASAPTVNLVMSEMPKEEVGRGLLAESELQGSSKEQQVGLLDPTPPTVTVGESGYGALNWNGDLDPEAIRQLPPDTVPAMNELKELQTFLQAFNQGRGTKAAAVELGLNRLNENLFRTRLLQRLFGTTTGSIVSDIKNNNADALLEPLLITEMKVLLETTQKIQMFP